MAGTSAVDAITPAFERAKQQLFQPFRLGQWARLALLGLATGELSSGGGCNTNFNFPYSASSGTTTTQHFLLAGGWRAQNPALFAALITVVVVLGLFLLLLWLYASSVCRFVLFESVIARKCELGAGWIRWQRAGRRYFGWQLLLLAGMLASSLLLLGPPMFLMFRAHPGQRLPALLLGSFGLLLVFAVFALAGLLLAVLAKDFVVPMMAMEDLGWREGWRRLLPMLNRERGSFAGYLGMKVLLWVGAAFILGIGILLVVLVLMIPLGALGVAVVLVGKAVGLGWNLYTITLAVVVGTLLLSGLLYVIALVSVPATVFFPAYSIHFFAGRYPSLDALLHPAPPPPPPPPVEPEPAPAA